MKPNDEKPEAKKAPVVPAALAPKPVARKPAPVAAALPEPDDAALFREAIGPVRVAIAREWIQPRWRLELVNEDGAVQVDFDEAGRASLAR